MEISSYLNVKRETGIGFVLPVFIVYV